MKSKILALAILCLPGYATAFSFVGDDWTFEYDATINVVTSLANTTLPEVGSDQVVVSQSVTDAFSFPFAIGAITGSGDFTVSGSTVTDINSGQTTDPFFVDFNGSPVQVRVTYPTWNLVGEVTMVSLVHSDAFGGRAFQIVGQPSTINNVKIEAFLGVWVDLGSNSSVSINSWSMNRSAEPVPEPSLMIAGAAGLVALARRKRKN